MAIVSTPDSIGSAGANTGTLLTLAIPMGDADAVSEVEDMIVKEG